MLDQSFSAENFKKILELENRKGKNLEKEFFPKVFAITKEISAINIAINKKLRSKTIDELALNKLQEDKLKLKNSKEELLFQELEEVSKKLLYKDFNFSITEVKTDGKPVYTVARTPENYFAMKQLQYNVRKTFKVKQANRFAIVNQIKCLLTDNFPKAIVRTDVKSFYESIPHDKLLTKINDNSLLSFLSKKLIWRILKDYIISSGSTEKIGIPRGIGVSAYLAELFMRDIDKEIHSLENVTYYARYVDDIIIIFTPTSKIKDIKYIDRVKAIIETDTGLKINELGEKTKEIELIKSGKKTELNFLGYLFQFESVKFQQIKLTEKKLNRYKERITITIKTYLENQKFDSKKARRFLIHRLNFLTSNTRLENNKENVLVGIYYSNSLLSDKLEDLIELDEFLYSQLDALISDIKLRQRLKLFSFKKGFEKKAFSNFFSKQKKIALKEILQIW